MPELTTLVVVRDSCTDKVANDASDVRDPKLSSPFGWEAEGTTPLPLLPDCHAWNIARLRKLSRHHVAACTRIGIPEQVGAHPDHARRIMNSREER